MQIRTLLFSVLFFFGIVSVSVQAQSSLSIQGTLQKSTGVSEEDGVYTLTFKLYTVETGGTPVWTEKQDSVVLLGGVYSVVLGTITPLTPAFDKPYFMGISVGSGVELNPRARLTSAPYALSLLGQSNTVPSAGSVGVGTITPTAGYQLHVKNPDAEAKVLIDGSSKSSLVFKKGANTKDMSYDGSKISVPGTMFIDTLTVGTLNSSGSADTVTARVLITKNSANDRIVVENTKIRIITANASGTQPASLNLNDCITIDAQLWDPYAVRFKKLTGSSGSAWFEGIAWAPAWGVWSDQRIKKDIRYSKGAEDLQSLLKLRVADYRLIDDEAGAKFHKGFIAQEVEQVLPDVVSTITSVVPDINAFAQRVSLTGNQLSIVLDTKHGLQVGDRVSIGADKDSKELFTVCKTETAQSFSVSNWASPLPEKLFVYGREVKDFKGVNYQEISNLNVSATQELARRVAELEAENAALRRHNEGLRGDVNGLGSRLAQLENLLLSKGKR
jgi:hypothetical protein